MAQIHLECEQQDGNICTEYKGTLENTSGTPLYVESDIKVTIATTTEPAIINGFTHGEIIISLFLFLIFMIGIFSVLWFGIIKPHIHKIHLK